MADSIAEADENTGEDANSMLRRHLRQLAGSPLDMQVDPLRQGGSSAAKPQCSVTVPTARAAVFAALPRHASTQFSGRTPAKIDVTFITTPELSWLNVVTLVDFKASLRPSRATEAVGQPLRQIGAAPASRRRRHGWHAD